MVRYWTRNRVEKLRAIARQGGTRQDAADEIGCTFNAVRHASRRYGADFRLGSGQIDAIQRAKVLDYYLANPGCTLSDVGRAIGRKPQVVGHMVRYLVSDGIMNRIGTNNGGMRYILTEKWFDAERKGRIGAKELYRKYLEEVQERVPQVCRVPGQKVPDNTQDATQGSL